MSSPAEVDRAPRGARKARGEQTPGGTELPRRLVGLKSPEGKAGRWGCGVWLPFGVRGVPDRASGTGKELAAATASGDLVPFQPSAGSRSRAGVLLSMGLALAERYAARPPSYSGFPSPALLRDGSCVAAVCLFGAGRGSHPAHPGFECCWWQQPLCPAATSPAPPRSSAG